MDQDVIYKISNKKRIFVFDAYGTKEGFANKLLNALNDLDYKGEYKSVAIDLKFVKHSTLDEQFRKFGLAPDQLVDSIEKYIR